MHEYHTFPPAGESCGGNFMVTAVMATSSFMISFKPAYKWLKLGRIKKFLDATNKKTLP